MTPKEIRNTVITVAVTTVVTAGIGWLIATSDRGMDAAEKARIKAVVREEMETDNGVSLKQEFRTLNDNVIKLNTSMEHLADAIEDLAQ